MATPCICAWDLLPGHLTLEADPRALCAQQASSDREIDRERDCGHENDHDRDRGNASESADLKTCSMRTHQRPFRAISAQRHAGLVNSHRPLVDMRVVIKAGWLANSLLHPSAILEVSQ